MHLRYSLLLSLLLLGACSAKTPNTPRPSASSNLTAEVILGLQQQLDKLKEAIPERPSASPRPPEQQPVPEPSASVKPTPLPGPAHICREVGKDSDLDGLSDACEQSLLEQYAPIVYHSSEETYFPLSVESYLQQSALWFSDYSCTPDLKQKVLDAPSQADLVKQETNQDCKQGNLGTTILSSGTRSKDKARTYYLADLPAEARKGSSDSQDWVTYGHVYPNNQNGATVQYWRLYAYKSGLNSHGGDWEGVHVVLNNLYKPSRVGLVGQKNIEYLSWGEITKEGDHPQIFAENGDHTSLAKGKGIKAKGCKGIGGFFSCSLDLENPVTFVRHETWAKGLVNWFNGDTGVSGGIVNVGEKLNPANGQFFIQYSGLWGSQGNFYASSGFWGPAYHDSGRRDDGYITAWAEGMLNPKREEAWPKGVSP